MRVGRTVPQTNRSLVERSDNSGNRRAAIGTAECVRHHIAGERSSRHFADLMRHVLADTARTVRFAVLVAVVMGLLLLGLWLLPLHIVIGPVRISRR